jgi:hypothetical protein
MRDDCGGKWTNAAQSAGCELSTQLLEEGAKGWEEVGTYPRGEASKAEERKAIRAAAAAGQVELREVTARQIFIGGKPVDGLLAPAAKAQPEK